MARWYDKYMMIYGKSFSEVSQNTIENIRQQFLKLQSTEPLVSLSSWHIEDNIEKNK